MLTSSQKLNLIAEKICQCEKCPELVKNRTRTVPGEGNSNAKIVILGEAGGKSEDASGVPFCGRSGQLLNNILKACNINREDLFITNINKCRPPNNRPPTYEESENCRPFLDIQLDVINPSYIICLGTTAVQKLLKTDKPIGQLRSQWQNYKNSKVMPTYHPSFALRNSEAKKYIFEDIMLVVKDLALLSEKRA